MRFDARRVRSTHARLWLPVVVAAGVAACSQPATRTGDVPTPVASAGAALARPAAIRVVALGDSLTAGYGLMADEAYPSVLDARLKASGLAAEVVNAGVSGDTSAGGLRRLDWALDGHVHVLIVALGGNDALRGLSVAEMKGNLAAIIERAQARQVAVILAGMEAPPNMGRAYTLGFRQAYGDLAATYRVAFLPFLLAGVGGVAELNQADGIHPNAAGARKVADNLWPLVESAVRAAGSS